MVLQELFENFLKLCVIKVNFSLSVEEGFLLCVVESRSVMDLGLNRNSLGIEE